MLREDGESNRGSIPLGSTKKSLVDGFFIPVHRGSYSKLFLCSRRSSRIASGMADMGTRNMMMPIAVEMAETGPLMSIKP